MRVMLSVWGEIIVNVSTWKMSASTGKRLGSLMKKDREAMWVG